MTKNYHTLALLGIGAVALLVYLWRESTAAQASPIADLTATPSNPSGAQTYAGAAPISLGNVDVGPSPLYLTYNQSPPAAPSAVLQPLKANASPVASCSCGGAPADDCNDSDIVNSLVTQTVIPRSVFDSAVSNLQGYLAKVAN